MTFSVVTRAANLRARVEQEIRAVYSERFDARLLSLPSVLVASISSLGAVDCAAGIRFSSDRLFSELYLDGPVEAVLAARFRHAVQRRHVIEVCHLVARSPGRSLPFVADVIEFAESAQAEWAIFTATRPLRVLLHKAGLAMTELARAEPDRVPNPAAWGRYYDYDPRVMAVRRGSATRQDHRLVATPVYAACANA